MESADGAWVYNNTIFLGHAYPNAIEYRFAASTNLIIRNNLTNRSITSRDGGSASLASNLTTAQHSWFVDPASGDLHLRSSLPGVINAGVAVSGLVDDFDRQARPHDGGYDIGADEYQAGGATSGRAMPWLFLLLAVAAFAVALNASSMVLAVLCLLVALGGTVAWVLGLLAQRVGNQARDDSMMLDPLELKRLRDEADARRAAAASGVAATATHSTDSAQG